MELSHTAYVVLGILNMRPRTGYEIKAAVDQSTRFFWAASYSQIYPELKRLEEAGLIEGESAPQGGRQRTVYKVTREGRRELQDWLDRPAEVFELRDEGLLKVFFAGSARGERGAELLRERAERYKEKAEQLREIEPFAKGRGFPYLILRSGIESSERAAKWFERAERELDKYSAEEEAVKEKA